jgi:hypothetical protein
MTKKNIQCSLAGSGRMMALRALGWHGYVGIMDSGTSRGRRRRRHVEEDGVVGSGIAWGAQRHRIREDDIVAGSGTTSHAWGRCLCGRRCH